MERFDVPGYSTYDEMLANEEIDISAPCLPVKANADAVITSAEAGVKGVFSEKPLAGSLADADCMVEECRRRDIPFAAGLVASSHPNYVKGYKIAAEGGIGKVVRINLYENNSQLGTHGLNLARKFANKADVDFITGFVSNDPYGEYEEDYGQGERWYGWLGGHIRFVNGIECFSSYTGPDYIGIEVIGTHGIIRNVSNTSVRLSMFRTDHPKNAPKLTEVKDIFLPPDSSQSERDADGWRKPSEAMMATITAVVTSIETGAPLEVTTGDDLRHSLELAIAIRQSARQDGKMIRFPIKDRSLVMYPQAARWNYKKDVHGRKWYREQMQEHIKMGEQK